jgi:hypothetical protein
LTLAARSALDVMSITYLPGDVYANSCYDVGMDDHEWNIAMLSKLDDWLNNSPYARKPLLQHMNMSAEGFIKWRETGVVAKETRLVWVIIDDEIWNRIHSDSV